MATSPPRDGTMPQLSVKEPEIEELESLHSMKSTACTDSADDDDFPALESLHSMKSPDGASVSAQGVSEIDHWSCDSASVRLQIAAFESDSWVNRERKMYIIPPALSSFREPYGAPVAMPLGPYSTGKKSGLLRGMPPDLLDMVDTVKDVATHHFRLGTEYGSIADMFTAFFSTVGDVRGLCQHTEHFLLAYGNEATADDTWLKFNMLRDGCFLVEYMQAWIIDDYRNRIPKLLKCYLESNEANINRDIMLLENQVPWVVIKTLSGMNKKWPEGETERVVAKFVAKMGRTLQVQVRRGPDYGIPNLKWREPPHLLGVLQSYKVGYSNDSDRLPPTSRPKSKTITAIELAEIGIKLKASKTTRLIDMGFKETLLGAEIFLAPLLLDEIRLCWLVNMVAFELCMAPVRTYAVACSRDRAASAPEDVVEGGDNGEKYAVSNYLVVLAMLMNREEDVHALRSKGLVQGQLTDKEIFDFFKNLVKNISGKGPVYTELMQGLEEYRTKRWVWIKLYKFIYNNSRAIAALLSIAGVLAGIFKTLLSIKQH